jgi:hypothetical protein
MDRLTAPLRPRPYHAVMGAAEALIVLAFLIVPLVLVVAGVVGVRRQLARHRALETRLTRLEDATVDRRPG